MQTENGYPYKARTTGQKVRWIVSICAVTFALLLVYRWNTAMTTPTIVIPTPTMPTPNAHDTFVSAGNQMRDDNKVGYAISPSSSRTSGNKDDHDYTLAEKDALIAENAPTLTTLREGLKQEYMNPPIRSMLAQMPYYARFRGLARLLALEAQARGAHGDRGGAMNSRLDALKMGMLIPHGAPMIGDLVGIACQAIGRKSAWQDQDRLSAAQAKAAAQRLEQIMAQELPYADMLQEEKWTQQSGMLELFRNPKNGETQSSNRALSSLFFLIYSKRSILHNNTVYMDQWIANAKQPYAAHPAPPPLPSDPFNKIILPLFGQTQIKNLDNQTQNRLLLVTLALRAYYVEHGAYPQSLNELAPTYLKRLPDDPFALQGTFKYRRAGNKYTLYSVGPDGIDDGGKMIDDVQKAKDKKSNRRYVVEQDSKGDIVAGKNIW